MTTTIQEPATGSDLWGEQPTEDQIKQSEALERAALAKGMADIERRKREAMIAAINPTGLKRGEKFISKGEEWFYCGFIREGATHDSGKGGYKRYYVLAAKNCPTPAPVCMVVYEKPIVAEEETPEEG